GLTEKQPKISYARIFKPWNWIIGSGVYIDDIEKGVRARIDAVIEDLNKTIGEQRIGESGYYFIFNEKNRILAHPGLAGSDGNHLINPETGGRLLEELKRAAAGPDRVMEYTWDKPGREGEYRFPKKAYITYFEPLGWYIGATVYKEDFERKISNLTNTILPFFASFLVTALMISLLVSKNVTKPLNRLIQSISKTDDDGIPILSIPETGATEINVLGGAMNHMIDSIIQSRKELKNQRDFSRHIIDGAPYIICGLHLDGVATFINPAGERATGYRREEIIGRNLWELLYPGEEYKQVEGVLNKFAEGEVVDHEMTLTCKNGERKNIVWSNFTKRDKHGAILEIIGFGNDVTERKRAEETLRVSEERLELAMSAANDGLWDWDLITDKVYFDPRYYTMIGYEVNEFSSSLEAFQSRVHPGDVDLVMEAVSDYLGGKSDSYDVEFRFARKDGGWTWIQARAKIVAHDPSGAPARFVGTHTDITERKQMELAVRESETQLRTLIETIPDLIWLKDPDGVYLSCNPEFERFFGAKEAEIAGKTDHDFVSKELADFFREKDKAAMAAGRPTTNEEEIIYAEDGRAALLETTKTPMVGPDGRLIGVLGIARDITGRKRAEKEIRRYQESLEDLVRERTGELEKEKERAEVANQAKGEFLANMSHELRTPLNHILGFTELVADQKVGELNEIQEDYLSDALSSGRHLLSLINDILDLSKVEAGKLELEMVRVDPRELLENSLVMVKEKAIR
ncbi:MAG: PAS domain S-box protein, partial [Desulfobacterales bacterium]|nr:PAS domain S-box protein [Desulfobacterales bacterium]